MDTCQPRLAPNGQFYIHKHDCKYAMEHGLPREEDPVESAFTDGIEEAVRQANELLKDRGIELVHAGLNTVCEKPREVS